MSNAIEERTMTDCPSWCTDHQLELLDDGTVSLNFHRSGPVAHTSFGWVSVNIDVREDEPGESYIYINDDRNDGEFSPETARVYAAALLTAADKLDEINRGVS